MFDPLSSERSGPIHTRLVVVVDRCGKMSVSHVQVCHTIFDQDEVHYTFISSVYLCFTQAGSCLILSTTAPCNGTTTAAEKVPRD